MERDKIIIIALVAIIAILAVCFGYMTTIHQDTPKQAANNTTQINNTTVKNATPEKSESQEVNSQNSESGQYGYCAICGKALTASEANHEITQGKVCIDCANNPYYQTDAGADYANRKLYEAYPDEYAWMYEDTDDNDLEDNDIEYDEDF